MKKEWNRRCVECISDGIRKCPKPDSPLEPCNNCKNKGIQCVPPPKQQRRKRKILTNSSINELVEAIKKKFSPSFTESNTHLDNSSFSLLGILAEELIREQIEEFKCN